MADLNSSLLDIYSFNAVITVSETLHAHWAVNPQ